MGTTPSVEARAEAGSEQTPGDLPMMAYTEKVLEEKEEQLRKYIQENYSKIRDVERELGNLTLELKLTAGPKKAALEHLRKKIEISTEKIRIAKQKEELARQVLEAAEKAVKKEEANKAAICEDLNRLVQESASAQYSRLEELKGRLEALNPVTKGVTPESVNSISIGLSPVSSENTATRKNNQDAGKMGSVAPDDKVISSVTSNQQLNESDNRASAISANSGSRTDHPVNSKAPKIPSERKGVDKSHPSSPGQSVKPVAEGQHVIIVKGRGHNVNRGKGNLILQKPKGETASGWTGAGFDVDARS
jgi:hypothetical protein